MKTLSLMVMAIIATCISYSQNVGIGTSTPHNSAALEIAGVGKGVLIPRMDSNARKSIVNPANGLMVYDISTNAFWYYNGTVWSMIGKKHYVGEKYGGGTVFYVDVSGEHGLIAGPNDLQDNRWYAGNNISTIAFANGPGAGRSNTQFIISTQGMGDGSTYAARDCNVYSVTDAGIMYSDWYMPSKYELNLMYLNRVAIGGFSNYFYWSSTESNNNGYAWGQDFNDGSQMTYEKYFTGVLRPVRAF